MKVATPKNTASTAATQNSAVEGPAFVQLLQAGDPIALGSFFDAHFSNIYSFVHRQVRHDQLAEDLTQDVFLNFHRSTERLDPERRLEPWLYTIAVNRMRDHWRSASYRVTEPNQDAEGEEFDRGLSSADELPTERIERDERAGTLHAAIEELPESLRSTLTLRAIEGLSFKRIAEIIGRNEVAVRKRYSRAVNALRELLPTAEVVL
jgi:RNA polymerase sigma-70 factor (ECF subfamily)